jgi:hypothetical protein
VDYGYISASTVAGSTCNARAIVPYGKEVVGIKNPQAADANGNLLWTYATPAVETGTGEAIVGCTHNGLNGTAYAYFATGNN